MSVSRAQSAGRSDGRATFQEAPEVDLRRVPAHRAERTRTADIQLLDGLRARLPSLAPGEAEAEVRRFLDDVAAAGGTPLKDPQGTRVAFLHHGTPTEGYSVAGTFNGWRTQELAMAPLGATRLHVAEVDLPRNDPGLYKLVDGAHWFEDARAQHVAWDKVPRDGRGQFNAVVRPEAESPRAGRLMAWRQVWDPFARSARDVFFYLPPLQDAQRSASLPLMIVNDGNEGLTRGTMAATADRLQSGNAATSTVLAFVDVTDPAARRDEYTVHRARYQRFLTDVLLPRIRQELGCGTAPERTGIAGVSLGGSLAAAAAFERPDVFGYAASQSGAFLSDDGDLLVSVAAHPRKPVRFYLDHGAPGDNSQSNRAFQKALKARGYPLTHREVKGARHAWEDWGQRFDGILRDFTLGAP